MILADVATGIEAASALGLLLFTMLVTFVGYVITETRRDARTEARLERLQEKVDGMSRFTIRRAAVAANINNVGRINGGDTIDIDPAAFASLAEIRGELRGWWTAYGHGMTDGEAIWRIESRWGEWIMKHVCLPRKLSEGECLLIALAVAKADTSVDLSK